ncbi:MAG: sulfotransferase domain-containing protein [Solirubrobacteraceae bacterium]
MDKDTIDFLVIGAAKSGTTTLFEHLRRHPDIWMPLSKEVPYFCDDELFSNGWQSHLAQVFADAPRDKLWGTSTPQYMAGSLLGGGRNGLPGPDYERVVPERIHTQLPEVRMIAILRDPIERCMSAYQMSVRRGLEKRSFDAVVKQLLNDEMLVRARRAPVEENGHVIVGEYARILAGYYAVFPAEQLLVVFTGELDREPLALMKRVFSHIGVDPDFVPPNLNAHYQPVNARARRRSLDPDRMRGTIGDRLPGLRSAWRRMPVAKRERLDRWFGEMAYRTGLWNRNSSMSSATMTVATERALAEHYRADVDRLAALTGREPPWSGRYREHESLPTTN